MAAPAVKMVPVSEDSSSSDDETLRRCQEAVWETKPDKTKDSSVQQSRRVVVSKHEHDGNELQVTEGFRSHVAKKLDKLLNSCITETQTETSSCVESAKCEEDAEGGFRLFSTSVPGQTAEDPPAPARRRPAPSSSDSDSEMELRLKEAAVSVQDLLPALSSAPSAELPCSKNTKKQKEVADGDESRVVKKKKKKKKGHREQKDSAGSPHHAQSDGEHGRSEQEVPLKVRRKKKKKREGNTEEEEASD